MAIGAPIERGIREVDISIAATEKNSSSFEVSRVAWGVFQLPAAISGTEFTVQFSVDGTNFTNAPPDSIGVNPITGAVANGTYFLPLATFAARYARIAATTQQAAACPIKIFMKS